MLQSNCTAPEPLCALYRILVAPAISTGTFDRLPAGYFFPAGRYRVCFLSAARDSGWSTLASRATVRSLAA